jgi:peptidyl-tRNA hydrolase
MSGLVQYVLVRADLRGTWPLGAIIAQACHACTAVIYQFRNDENVVMYTTDMDNMHKCVLEVK